MKPVYVTGNEHKARLFNKMVGVDLSHERADIEEIQSTDLLEIVEHKARKAYEMLNKPVVVEDTKLVFHVFGKLPGPYIKWFLEEVGNEGMCKMLDGFDDRSATAGCAIAYFDGKELKVFHRENNGQIANQPSDGTTGFGWDAIFIPESQKLTRAEMDEETYYRYYKKTKPFDELAEYLRTIL